MKKNDWSESVRRAGQLLGKFKYPLAILLLGLVLLAIPVRTQQPKRTEEPEAPAQEAERAGADELAGLETRMAQILSQIEGAGQVQVMLRYASGTRTVYQTDSSQEVSTDSEGKQTKTEIQTVMSSGSGGQSTPVAVQTICPTFQGALVVSQGADSAAVKLNLVSAVSSLTGLGADKITVIKMK